MVETYIIKEAALRITIIVMGLLSLLSASIWIHALNNPFGSVVSQYLNTYSPLDVMSLASQRSSAGWTIFLSLVTGFYQCFATVNLFVPIKDLQKLTVRLFFWKTKWYILQLIDLVICSVHAIGYLCVVFPMIVYFFSTIVNFVIARLSLFSASSVGTPAIIASLSIILLLIVFMDIGAGVSIFLIFEILKSKYAYKRPNHYISEISPAISDASNMQLQLGNTYQQMQ